MLRARFIFSGVLACVAMVAGCGADPTIDSATQAVHSLDGLHWARTSNPFTLQVGDNLSPAWQTYLDTALADWSVSTVMDLTKASGGALDADCGVYIDSGRVEVCNGSYGQNGWLGLAFILQLQDPVSGEWHISAAAVKLNDSYLSKGSYKKPAWHRYTLCQEIGHTLGLDHQDEDFYNPNLGSCMDYTSNPAGPPSNEHPNAHDYEELALIYSHTDSYDSYAGGTSPARVSAAENDWGELVHGSRELGVSIYRRDEGAEQVITKVIWAR